MVWTSFFPSFAIGSDALGSLSRTEGNWGGQAGCEGRCRCCGRILYLFRELHGWQPYLAGNETIAEVTTAVANGDYEPQDHWSMSAVKFSS